MKERLCDCCAVNPIMTYIKLCCQCSYISPPMQYESYINSQIEISWQKI